MKRKKEELNEEQIKEKKKVYMPQIIECLKTKSFVEGVNDVHGLITKDYYAMGWKAVELMDTLNVSTVKWLYTFVTTSELSLEEREMRIKQIVVLCFYLADAGDIFRKTFKHYVVPLLIKPGYSKRQIIEAIKKKLYEVSQCKERDEIASFYLSNYEGEIKRLERMYPSEPSRKRMRVS